MLILTLEEGGRVVIDGGIVITVVDLGTHRVRLGIDAPPECRVDREEIRRRRLWEQARAREEGGSP